MSVFCREEGASRFAVFFWLFLLFAVIHIGLLLVPMYMDFWRMEDELNARAATAQIARPGDDELKYNLAKYAKELDLPLSAEHFVVVRDEERRQLKISTAWDVELRFFWGICGEPCVRRYHFEPSAEGKI